MLFIRTADGRCVIYITYPCNYILLTIKPLGCNTNTSGIANNISSLIGSIKWRIYDNQCSICVQSA